MYTDDIDTSEEWLRYTESKAIMQRYNIFNYSDRDAEEVKEKSKEEPEEK